jgi:hypothetical protein
MAKQLCNYITGTFDELCFYKMEGQYYIRVKSSLTSKRVKNCSTFKNTMESARQLAAASVIASQVYRTVSKEKRKVELYRKMTGIAKLLFKNGKNNEKVFEHLTKYIANIFTKGKIFVKPLPEKRTLFKYINAIGMNHNNELNKERVKFSRQRKSLVDQKHKEKMAKKFTPMKRIC